MHPVEDGVQNRFQLRLHYTERGGLFTARWVKLTKVEALRLCRSLGRPRRDACELRTQAARYPNSSQPNTSFPILIRTSPTSKIPAEPLSWEPRPAFNAGIVVSGKRRTVEKGCVSSLGRSPKDGEAGRRVGGSGVSDGVGWARRSRSTQAKDAWNRGRS